MVLFAPLSASIIWLHEEKRGHKTHWNQRCVQCSKPLQRTQDPLYCFSHYPPLAFLARGYLFMVKRNRDVLGIITPKTTTRFSTLRSCRANHASLQNHRFRRRLMCSDA